MWCIDEVHVILENGVKTTILKWICLTVGIQISSKTFQSSTSLDLPDRREMISQWVELYGEMRVQEDPDCMSLQPTHKIVSEFQRFCDFLHFWNLYQ